QQDFDTSRQRSYFIKLPQPRILRKATCRGSVSKFKLRHYPCRKVSRVGANVAGSACIFEAADGFGKHLLRQPKPDLLKKNHEPERDQEDAIDWQRRA